MNALCELYLARSLLPSKIFERALYASHIDEIPTGKQPKPQIIKRLQQTVLYTAKFDGSIFTAFLRCTELSTAVLSKLSIS
jgi:hypothetical protein